MSSTQLRKIEKIAKSIEEAIADALVDLDATRDMVDIEIIEEGSKGLFGILGGKDAHIIVTMKNGSPQHSAEEFLGKLFAGLGVEVNMDIQQEDGRLEIDLSGESMGIIIGKRGETLDSIQYITSLVVNSGAEDFVKVSIDTENYREKRKEALERLASRIIDKVLKSRRRYILEPMNPYERRVIHSYVQGDDRVATYSIGDEPNRKVVIALKGDNRARK